MDAERPGYDATNLYRNNLATYFLPTVHEWHKAAYYDPNAGVYYTYPTGSNSVPDGIDFPGDPVFDAVFYDGGLNSGPNVVSNAGLFSPYGTMGQGGNVSEWAETAFDWINNGLGKGRTLGGSWGDGSTLLAGSNANGIQPSDQVSYPRFSRVGCRSRTRYDSISRFRARPSRRLSPSSQLVSFDRPGLVRLCGRRRSVGLRVQPRARRAMCRIGPNWPGSNLLLSAGLVSIGFGVFCYTRLEV